MYTPTSLTRRAGVALVLAVALVAAPVTPVQAGSVSIPLNVTVTVETNCIITTGTLAFGSYDPVVANASTALDGTGSVSIACTKGTAPTIGLGLGSNANGTTRRMKDAGSNYLSYELYYGSAGGTVWGTTGGALLTADTFLSKAAVPYTVHGRIPAGQDVPAGAYSDTVTATVNF